jgi:hypothetical protein
MRNRVKRHCARSSCSRRHPERSRFSGEAKACQSEAEEDLGRIGSRRSAEILHVWGQPSSAVQSERKLGSAGSATKSNQDTNGKGTSSLTIIYLT